MSRTIAQDIAAADRAYAQAVDAAATRLRAELIAPYCDKYNLDFVGGMGSWCFHSATGGQVGISYCTYGMRELPQRLRAALGLETYNGQSLGSLCLDYRTINRSK